ncbi:gas vesicle protein [Sphaerospermopsis aphanizomenoides BCCUSP55]|uniref:gas vesicle protein n=1 Tax=Sphaerospermopsis aphanizomenoides TaxID=459663 RepID=UPI001902E2E4|nr:gas vesicle protein [Sphaerospermopsis aphanizomenoides]MBK1989403.1 gas vesicle protein [Sphaerospermopsis aphanizomenoides BCCUSP55]
MNNIRNRGMIRAKVSTMPRNKSDASSQLELYKMVTEKQRIQRELYGIKDRMFVLQQRLDVLNNQIEETEKTIHKLRQPQSRTVQNIVRTKKSTEPHTYNTFEIEY